MVIALPFGAAGIVLIDLLIGIAILCIILLAFAALKWSANAAKGLVGGLPVVGGAASFAVDRFSDAIWNLARGFEQIQSTYVWNVSVRVVQLLNWTVGVAFRPWATLISNTNNIANEARGIAWWVQGTFVPAVTVWLTNTTNIANEARSIAWYFRDTWRPLWEQVINNTNNIANEARALAWYFRDHAIPDLQRRTHDLEGLADNVWPYVQLLKALASFEGGILARAAALEADLAIQKGRVQVLEQELAKVMPLAAVAAIGAIAILNLERVARDPCHCLTIGDFSDLPSRVGALESLGP